MKSRARWIALLLALVTFATLGQNQPPTWSDSREYEAYLQIYSERDLAKKAAGAEKFLTEHKDADPAARTQVYMVLFFSYANDSNWRKVIETYDRMSLAPRLTEADKQRFAQIVEVARSRMTPAQDIK